MLKIWWTAVRPISAVKVVLPTLVGLAIGFGQKGQAVKLNLIGLGLLFAWLDQLVIILLNDYADAPADILHTEKYPELIDKRAVPHAWLERRNLLAAGLVSAAAMVGVTLLLALFFERPHATPLGSHLRPFFSSLPTAFPLFGSTTAGWARYSRSWGSGGCCPSAILWLVERGRQRTQAPAG